MTHFDIHVDATYLSAGAERHIIETMGFVKSDFCGHPPGLPSFEPAHHLTLKPTTGRDYRTAFDGLKAFLEGKPKEFNGYIEGEAFTFDKDLTPRNYGSTISVPFTLDTRSLVPGTFRESEIHVTMSRDLSSPELLNALVQMGLFSAYISKPYGVAQVFTAQGTQKQIATILPKIVDYLERTGGATHCSVKEERIVGWWLSGPKVSLPPVIDSVSWR